MATVQVRTDYPFGDVVSVVVTVPATPHPSAVAAWLRIPGWAVRATVAVDGRDRAVARNGTLHRVDCGPGRTVIDLELNPDIRLQFGWGALERPGTGSGTGTSTGKGNSGRRATNAVAVFRGPLLYSLRLPGQRATVKTWQPFRNTDDNVTTDAAWNYAILLSERHPMAFVRARPGPGPVPWNTSDAVGRVRFAVVRLNAWQEETNAAAEPPPSPLSCQVHGCGEPGTAWLVPYGASDLRIAAFPWTTLADDEVHNADPPGVEGDFD